MCVVIEAAGQALIWLAPQPMLVFAGAALAGLGYALVSGHRLVTYFESFASACLRLQSVPPRLTRRRAEI